MSQQASFYYHIDADGNYWFPLFPDAEIASFVDGDLYGSSNPGAHEHEFGGSTWYMPNTMASADNDFIGGFHAVTLDAQDAQDLSDDGGANITSFSFDGGGDGGGSEVPIDNPEYGSGEAPVDPIPGDDFGSGDDVGAPSYDTKYELQPNEEGYTGTDGADAIKFGIGDNQLVNGGAGDDFIYSWSGTGDVLVGSSGNDVLQVRTQREVIEVAAGEFPEIVVTSAVTTHSYGNDFPMGLFGFFVTGTDVDFSSVDITATVRGPNGEAQIFPYSAEGAGFISAGSLNDKTMIVIPGGLGGDVVNGAYFDIIALDPDPGSYELLNVTASQNGNTIASVEPEGVYFEIAAGQNAATPSTTFYYDSVAVAYGSEPVTQVFGGDIDENGNPTSDDSGNDTLFLTGLSQDYSIARGSDADAGEVILRNNLTGGTVIAKQIENFTFQFGYNQETIALSDLPIDARLQTELEYQENPGPVIEAVLPTADLVNLVPEFADVGDANLDLPLVLRNKPTGEAYIELGAPVAETDDLYLYVAEWQGESIILGSPKNYYSESLVKLNLAADPIAQNSNFEIDVDFYTSFATGEIRSFEALSQYIDDPDNAFGLGPLEILTEQPDISNVPDIGDIDVESLKYIKLTPGSDRYDNVLGTDTLNIIAGDGDDNIVASSGADFIDGGNGNDTIRSNPGNDVVLGGLGDDVFLKDFVPAYVPTPAEGARVELLTSVAGPSGITGEGIGYWSFGVTDAGGRLADNVQASVNTPFGQIDLNGYQGTLYVGDTIIVASVLASPSSSGFGSSVGIFLTAVEYDFETQETENVELPAGQYSLNYAAFSAGSEFLSEVGGDVLYDKVLDIESDPVSQVRQYTNNDPSLGYLENSDNIDGGEHFDIFRTANPKGDFQLFDGEEFAVLVHKTSGETIKLTNVEQIEFSNATVSLASGTGQNAPETPRPDIEYFSESFVDLQGNSVIEYFAEGGAKDDLIIYQGNISGGAGNDIIIEDPDENLTPIGDIMAGGKGNDFIDGGRQGTGERSEENFNVADYDGPVRNFSFETKVYSEDADKAEIDALIVDLGLEAAADYLVDGQSYFIVTDSRGDKGQGTDIVTNVQEFSFTDDYLILEATTYTYEYSQEVWPEGFYIAPGMTPVETGVMERPSPWNPDDTESYYGGSDGWDVYEYELDGGAADASYVVFFKRYYDGAPAYDGYVDGPVYQRDAEGNYTAVRIDHVVLEGRGSALADDIIDASAHEDSPTQANLSGAGGNDILIGTTGNDHLEGNAGNDFIDGKGSADRDVVNYNNIRQSRFEISSMTYSESADKDTLDALIVELGLANAADYLVDGQQYLIVEDKRGDNGEGTDILANVENISFKDNYISLGAEEYVRTDFFNVWPEDFYVSAADTPAATGIQERVQSGGYVEQFSMFGQTHGWDAYSYDYADGEDGVEYFVLFKRYDESSNQGQGYIDGGVYTLNEGGQYQIVTQEVVRLDSYGSAYADDVLDASARDDNPTSAYMDGKGGDDVLIGTLGADNLNGGAGDDFIDGRGSASKANEYDFDRASYEGSRSQYKLTYYDMANQADVAALQTLIESLDLSVDSYLDTGEGYYISVADKVGGRDGTDIVTGVDKLEFNDEGVRLTVEERLFTEERQLQTPWSWMPGDGDTPVATIESYIESWGGTRTPYDDSAEWRVYAYDDGDDSTELYVVFNYRGEYEWGIDGWPEALVTRSDDGQGGYIYRSATETISRYDATGSFLPDVITTDADSADIRAGGGNDIVTLSKEGHVRAGDGDDIVYGGTGQNEIYGEAGNDVIVGGANGGGEDRASYFGQEKFFDIYQLRYAGSDLNIKDALGNSIYRVTAQEDGSGSLSFAGSNETVLTLANGDSFIVVNDLLPAKFGGQGVDLLTGIERISFYGEDYFEIQTGVSFWDDTWNNRTEANGSIFDDVMDFRAGRAVSVEAIKARGGNAEDIQAQGLLHASNMRGDQGNDVMLGGYGADFFNPGKGDDFIDGGSASELSALVTDLDPYAEDIALTDPNSREDGTFDIYRVHNEQYEYWALRDDNTLFQVNYDEIADTYAAPDFNDQSNNRSWSNNDTVQYSGTRLRYDISTVYVELDENGLPVRDASGGYNVLEESDYTDQAGYEKFFRVTDVLPDAAGGLGTDYLRNIEELYFSDGSQERLAVQTNSWTDRHEKNDYSWRPPQTDGLYDVTGGVEITQYVGAYGDLRSKDDDFWDTSTWYVFQHTDSDGNDIDGQFILWHHNEGDGYNWGWADRVLASDDQGGYTQLYNTTTRSDVRGTVIGDKIEQTVASDDEIKGYAGDDTIEAGDGRDRVKGGLGNDVIWGGDANSVGWDFNGDIAYFAAARDQYKIIRDVFIKPAVADGEFVDSRPETDAEGRFIVYSADTELVGRGIVRQETSDDLTEANGYYEATIVIDTLVDELGGEGVDILLGFEGAVFGSTTDWLPHVGSYISSGDNVGSGGNQAQFIGLQPTTSVETYGEVRLRIKGTDFNDTLTFSADDIFFDNNNRPYSVDEIEVFNLEGSAGDDVFDMRVFASQVDEPYKVGFSYGLSFGEASASEYSMSRTDDGGIRLEHLSEGAGNTGIDIIYGAGEITFGDQQITTDFVIDGDNVRLSWMGDDLNGETAGFSDIQANDNYVRADGGFGNTSNIDAGAGADTLRVENTPIWQTGITFSNGIWTVSDNMGSAYGSNGTIKATNFELIELGDWNDLSASMDIADPDNVSINIDGRTYEVSSYNDAGELLDADGNKVLEIIVADLDFASSSGNVIGTDNDDEFLPAPGDQFIFAGAGSGDLVSFPFGKFQRYSVNFEYDQDLDGDGVFDNTGIAVSGNESYVSLDGIEFVKYLKLEDGLSSSMGGTGTDLLFGFERIYFNGMNRDLVPQVHDGSSRYFNFKSMIENEIVFVSDDTISSLTDAAGEAEYQRSDLSYEVSFGDVVVGSGARSDKLNEYVNLMGAQTDTVGVVSNSISIDELASMDLNSDGVTNVEDSLIANLLLERNANSTSINQLILSDKAGGKDDLVVFGVNTVRIGNADFNLTVTTNRDSNGKIWDVRGTELSDTLIGDDTENNFFAGSGTDFIDGVANVSSEDQYWTPRDYLNFDGVDFERAEFSAVQVVVNADGTPGLDADKKLQIVGYAGEAAIENGEISFAASSDAITLGEGEELVSSYMIADQYAASNSAYFGVKIIRNIDGISFNDRWVEIATDEYTNEYTDWRGETVRETRRNGTIFSEAIVGGLGMDFIEGREGDDYLFGGVDGDRLNGGLGNDILYGGENGNSGDSWRDLDIAEYWNESRERFQIFKVKVDTSQFENFSPGQTTTIVDAFGVFADDAAFEGYAIADSSEAELTEAYLVVDFLPGALGGSGNDLLIDVEQINFEGETVDLGLRIWADDWNQDDVLDWVRVEGTDDDDDIREWGDEARLSADSEILGKAGNDILFGYAGGDRLSGGTGNDFIDGGADGVARYGWTPKDEAYFSGVEANYIITNHAYGDEELTELAAELGYAELLATYAPAEGEVGPNFTIVRDTKPEQLGGSGTDILVNVEFIGLQDNYLPLAVEKNADVRFDFDSDGDGLYDVTGENVDDPEATGQYTVYWVSGTSGSDQISGGIGDDYLSGNAGDDTLVGDRGADYFEPGAGDDYIDGGENGVFEWNRDDVVRFSGSYADYDIGSGFDDDGRLEVIVTDLREEGDGVNRLVNIERIEFSDQSISIGLSERIMYLRNDLINGLDIQGSAFDDVIEGSYPTDENAGGTRELGNDYISGEEGDDILYGYAGQDTFVGGQGDDKIYGGENGVDEFGNEGGDTVIYHQDYANYTISYKTSDGLNADSFVSGGYILVSDDSDDEFSDGTDEIYGVERIVFADTELTFETKIESVDADGDGIADIASVTGTMQDDLLYGTGLDEIFSGQGGNDAIFGRVGNDLFEDSGTDGNDLYVGGGGEDRLSVSLAADAYNIVQTFIGFDADGQVLRDEAGEVAFFATADRVTAGATAKAAVKLTNSSNGQVDVVSGVEYIDFNGDLTALAISVGRAKFATDGSLSQIDVFGTLGDDTISVDALATSGNYTADDAAAIMAADNFIFGGRGVDVIDAGAGNDQIILDTTNASDGSSDTVLGGEGIDRVDLTGDLADWTFSTADVDGVTYDTLSNGNQSIRMSGVESVSFDDEILNLVVTSIEIDRNADGEADGYQIGGTLNDDTLISTAGDLRDILKGGTGNDIVAAQAGDDIIIEGAGNDVIIGGDGFDTVSYNNVAADTTIAVGGYVLRNSATNEFVAGFTTAPSYVAESDISTSSTPLVYAVVEDSYLAAVASDFDADNNSETVDVVSVDTDRDGEADTTFADLDNDGMPDLFAQGSDAEGFDAATMTLAQVTLAYEQADGEADLFYENVVSEKVFSATTGSNTDTLIGVELVEFADQALDLQPSATDASSFSAAAGIVQTREIEGTGFADVVDTEALDEILALGGGNDIVRVGSDSGADIISDFDVKNDIEASYASVGDDFDPDNDADTADKVSVDVDGDGEVDGTFADLNNDGIADEFASADDENFDPQTMTLEEFDIVDEDYDVIEIQKLLNDTNINSYEGLRARMSDTNLGVEISLGSNEAGEEQQIILEGVTVDELSASNFAFVDVL